MNPQKCYSCDFPSRQFAHSAPERSMNVSLSSSCADMRRLIFKMAMTGKTLKSKKEEESKGSNSSSQSWQSGKAKIAPLHQ